MFQKKQFFFKWIFYYSIYKKTGGGDIFKFPKINCLQKILSSMYQPMNSTNTN